MHLYDDNLGLTKSTLKAMSIEELFDLRHDMLDLINNLAELLKE